MAHLINRLRFEARCSEEEQAFALRQSFARTLQPEIAAIVDAVCSEYVSDDEWLQIETLEIDLGGFSPQSFARDFSAVFRERFATELGKKLGAVTFEQRRASRRHSRLELFRHFMTRGTLPWWASETETNIDELVQELLAATPRRLRALLYECRENRPVWIRTALQLHGETQCAVISLVDELQNAEFQLLQWVKAFSTGDLRSGIANEILAAARSVLLFRAPEVIGVRENAAAVFQIFAAVVKEIAPAGSAALSEFMPSASNAPGPRIGETSGEAPHPAGMNAAADGGETKIPMPTAVSESVTPYYAEELIPEKLPASLLTDFLSMHAVDARQNGTEFSSGLEADGERRYVVRHSGIILAAPFFRNFFDACGLLDGTAWKNKQAQYQAMHLLKYLCTGSKKTPEYSLTLEKLCCGIAIEEPVPTAADLREQQLQEARDLLAALIGHWKALKNTSIGGLRETFLKRDGLLSTKHGGWLLQIERKTLDVLLDGIPWGYSTVALPWNDYLIHVEW
jgi:hypothetical protein